MSDNATQDTPKGTSNGTSHDVRTRAQPLDAELDFAALFTTAPGPYLVLAPNAPRFTILAVNDAYLGATMTERDGPDGIIGRDLFEVFPDNPNDADATGEHNLRQSLMTVLSTRAAHSMAVQKYDIPIPDVDGGFEERYWSPINTPVLASTGDVLYIIHHVEDVTDAARLARLRTVEGEAAQELRTRNMWLETEIVRRTEAEAAERALGAQLQDQAAELEEHAAELEQQIEAAQNLTQELEQANEQLLQRTIESEMSRAQAEAARRAAEVANEAKSGFLAMMSHEIRTPINAIVGYTELLELQLAGPVTEGQLGYLSRVRSSARHLLGVVDEVLDVAKIESGKMHVARIPCRAGDAVRAAVALVAPQAAARAMSVVDCSDEDGDSSYYGDEARVRQILANLLSNAIRACSSGGRVVVTCGVVRNSAPLSDDEAKPDTTLEYPVSRGGDPRPAGSWVYIRVSDTGVGIAPDKFGTIFDPFVQGESGLTRTSEGAGLGLTISRRLARLMGGALTAQSAVGHGSTFTLWLPPVSESSQVSSLPMMKDDHQAAAPTTVIPGHTGLKAMGELLLSCIPDVVDALIMRLRQAPSTPNAYALTTSQLEDHFSSFLANVAQTLCLLEESKGDPSLLRDSTEIQRLIAERHGAQRERLGWTETGLYDESRILRDVITDAVRHIRTLGSARNDTLAAAVTPQVIDATLAALGGMLDQAERMMLQGFRLSLGHSDVRGVWPSPPAGQHAAQ